MKKPLNLKLNKSLILFCLLLINYGLTAQTVENLYINMPDGLNPTLTKQNRLELLEYYKAKQGDTITNRFGNQTHLLFFDSIQSCLVVQNTPTSVFEMKIFNVDSITPAIGIIRTVCSPICQSVVEFYDTAWNSTPIVFTMPKATEWIDTANYQTLNIDRKWVEKEMETGFITLSFNRSDSGIIATNNTLEFLSDDDRKQIAPLVSDKPILYNFNGKTWIRKP